MHKPTVTLWTLEDCVACPDAKKVVKSFCEKKKLKLRVLDPTEETVLAQQHGVKLVPHVQVTCNGNSLGLAGVVKEKDLSRLLAAVGPEVE